MRIARKSAIPGRPSLLSQVYDPAFLYGAGQFWSIRCSEVTPPATSLRVVARRPVEPAVQVRTLFDAPELMERSPWSTFISFVLHTGAFAGLAALAYFNISIVSVHPRKSLEFVGIAIAPPVEVPVKLAAPPRE